MVAKTWWPFVSIGYAFAVLSSIGIFFFYPESTCYLVKKGLFEEAQESFANIQRINGIAFKSEN